MYWSKSNNIVRKVQKYLLSAREVNNSRAASVDSRNRMNIKDLRVYIILGISEVTAHIKWVKNSFIYNKLAKCEAIY